MEAIGWWMFDAATLTLTQPVSGQRVRFEGARGEAWLFAYEDREIGYPVLVTPRRETYGGPGYDHRDPNRLSLAWSIDHVGSATLWREGEVPPYGLWRRVDDALFDALACWPQNADTGPQPARIDSWGGWVNGVWSPRLRRVAVGRADNSAAPEAKAEPWVEPLVSPAPIWRFVDARRALAEAGPVGMERLRNGLRLGAPLAGFENAILHLRRSDGNAVMFPYRVQSRLDRDGFYDPCAEFFYADEDVFFGLNGRAMAPPAYAPTGAWQFDQAELLDFGVRRRRADLPTDLVSRRQVYSWRGPQLQPLPRLAQRLCAVLVDGWLAWVGSPLRLADDAVALARLGAQGGPEPMPPLAESGFDLAAKAFVVVEGGYHGGRFIRRSLTAYLQREGWSEAGCPLPFYDRRRR